MVGYRPSESPLESNFMFRQSATTTLQASWLLLGALHFTPSVVVVIRDRPFWGAALLGPWLAGAFLLTGPRRQSTTRHTMEALGDTSARIALIVWVGLLWAAGYILSEYAALFLANWLGCFLLFLAYRGRIETLRAVVVNLSLVGIGLLVSAVTIETILHLPRVAATLGTPDERRAWNQRYDGLEQRNIFGFRTPYESLEKPPNTFRVIALGDSFTWGDKIAHTEDTWPAQLEGELEQQVLAQSVEVVNLGHRGYTTANEAELLRRLGWAFDPDLVVVQYFLNDALPSGPDFARKPMEWLLPFHFLVPWHFRTGAIAGSATLSVIEGRWTSLLTALPAPLAYPMLYHADSTGWQQARTAMQEMGHEFQSRGVPGLLVIFPELLPGAWTEERYPHLDLHLLIAGEARSAGFLVLDLLPTFVAAGGEWQDWWATEYDRHPNEAAHALAARAIASFLVDQETVLVPSP